MKYLLIVLCIIGLASLASLLSLVLPGEQPAASDTVVTINDRPISRQSIREYSDTESHHRSSEEALDVFVTRQLLIAEAQRRDIDKEAGFRNALKNYYEHSLIKLLLDRVSQEQAAAVTVDEAEVDAYLACFGKTFTFFTLATGGEADPQRIRAEGERHSTAFENLSTPLQLVLAGLEPGQSGSTYITGNDKIAVYLAARDDEPQKRQNIDRETARRQLLQAKQESQLNSWIEHLRRDATITYHTTRE